jgi:hypothetical protein
MAGKSSTKKKETSKIITEGETPKIANEEVSDTETNTRKKIKQIDRNEMIPCRSVTSGQLTYISKRTGLMTIWNDFGVVEYLEYGELISMRAAQPKFLTKPWIIIEDSDVVDSISGLKELYDSISQVGEDLESFFKRTPSEFESILSTLPNGTKGLIAFKAREMIDNGSLYDMRIINIIDKYLNTGLKDFIR